MRTSTEIQRDMHDYLPRYYEDIPVATNVIDREAVEMAQLNADIYDVLAQMFVDTSTWGLARWERIFGITTDVLKPIDQRRSVIKSRIRGVGTVTPAMVKSIAEAYANGDVEVTEAGTNMLPPFNSGWTLHSNAVIVSDYVLKLNATGAYQENQFDFFDFIVGQTYTFSVLMSANAQLNIRALNAANDSLYTSNWTTVNTITFTVPANTVKVRFYLSSNTAGTFTFTNPQLERGSVRTPFENLPDYTIGIKFVSSLGIPANLYDLETVIRETLPAHLAVRYEFTYVTYGKLEGYSVTFGAIETAGLTFGTLESWEGP